jgi:uncharacterized protein (DUF488 family)
MTTGLGTLIDFGYGSLRSVEDLARLLGAIQADLLVDVRFSRRSRNPLFSGDAAGATARAAGVASYVAEPRLGNPSYRTAGTQGIADAGGLETVLAALREGRNVALMCACAELSACHRRTVINLAEELEPQLRTIHLR